MGLGWNLGNALDSTNTWTSNPSPADIETAWGNVVATENMIKEVKKAGFNTVRIPVTWWDMTGASGTAKMDSFDGTVADQYLARVKEVVDYCVDNGMYAIINTHHDEEWERIPPRSQHLKSCGSRSRPTLKAMTNIWYSRV